MQTALQGVVALFLAGTAYGESGGILNKQYSQELPQRRVIVLGVDGLGVENVWRDSWNGVEPPDIPNIESIRSRGAWTLRAGIDERNFSGPNWMGMLTGSVSGVHGVITNDCERGEGLPTIFKNLKSNIPGHTSAVVFEWTTIACYPEAGTVSHFSYSTDAGQTADEVVRIMTHRNPGFIFVDFDEVDSAGHRDGGHSQHYKETVERVDTAIGQILQALETSGLLEKTYIIFTADHGHKAAGGGHSSSLKPVPFFLMGPGVKKGEITEPVFNRQVAPLVSMIMGTEPEAAWATDAAVFQPFLQRP